MKNYLTFFLLLGMISFIVPPVVTAEKITFSDSWGQTGFNLESQNSRGVQIVFSLNEFYLEDEVINGENVKTLQVPGIFLPNNAGAPNLPGTGRFIAVPQGARVEVRILSSRTTSFKNVNIGPAPRIPLETEEGPLQYFKDLQIYSKDQYYPETPVRVSEMTQIRGVDAVLIGVTPFQYNPVSRELIVYQDIQIEVSFNGGNGHFGEDRLRNRWWDPILRDIFLNQEALQEVEYIYRSESLTQDFEYVIITPDNPQFLPWADSIKVFRNRQGIRTGVVTLTEIGGNTTTAIENYVNNAYNTWTIPPVAVLLMADYGTGGATGNGIISPVYDNYCISDHIYADVNNDHMADIIFARLTAQNSSHLEIMVRKFLNYEKNPPTNPNYYLHPITAMGWQTERWFQICSETINGFWEYVLGKQPVRENAIYSGTPTGSWSSNQNTSIVVNYFGPNGLGYIPATPNHLNDWGGNATRINNDINSGAFMIQHRDHGYEQGWGEPAYSSSNLAGLNNNDLVFIMSINCLTGKFNISGDCFAEAAHRYPKRALGVIAASETSYSFVNDTYCWGMYDNMWPNFMPAYGTTPASRGVLPAFANVAGKYFLQQSSWPYNPGNKEVTYYLFHHHGDAFSTVYSELPQNLTVIHNAVLFGGQSTFTVTADQDALIALTVNDEIIGVATGTGGPISISIPPQVPGNQMLVTVTKQNYYRYSQTVMITAATGPYLYCMNTVALDTNLNNNGIPEAGETIALKLQLTNLGVQGASNVTATLSSADTFLTILNGMTTIAVVDTGDTLIDGSFLINIHENTPHLHRCTLDLQLEADSAGIPGGYQWNQTMQLSIRQGSRIELSSDQLAFVPTFLNFTSQLPLVIHNAGADTLKISQIAVDLPQFSVSTTNLTIAPNGSQNIQIFFTPDDTLDYHATITIINNDPIQFVKTFTTSGTGINAPDITTLPVDTVYRTLSINDSVVQPVIIKNEGLGELTFNLQVAGWDPGNGEGAGGSDTYGHMWIDSDEPNGPSFDWVDISLSGNELPLTGNNTISDQINLGFSFTFYGVAYNSLRVCTNGWISFTTFSVAYNNVPLPSNLAPRTMLAPLWDDLNFQSDSKVYYQNQGNKFVIMYKNIYRISGEGPYNFEIILFDNDNIVFQYLSLQNLVDDYTVGIQNHLADDGLTIAFNESYLHDSLAVLISRATWVSVSPLGGTIPAQSEQEVYLTLVTHNFPEGEFWACLQIESNDPDEGLYILPIHMTVSTVTGGSDLSINVPKEFKLYQNSPNPFNPTTVIAYDLPNVTEVQLIIYNVLGQKIKTLVHGQQQPKQYKVVWDGTNDEGSRVASGIYIYQLRTPENLITKKMILMK